MAATRESATRLVSDSCVIAIAALTVQAATINTNAQPSTWPLRAPRLKPPLNAHTTAVGTQSSRAKIGERGIAGSIPPTASAAKNAKPTATAITGLSFKIHGFQGSLIQEVGNSSASSCQSCSSCPSPSSNQSLVLSAMTADGRLEPGMATPQPV